MTTTPASTGPNARPETAGVGSTTRRDIPAATGAGDTTDRGTPTETGLRDTADVGEVLGREVPLETVRTELAVVGGGLAGVCAAIAAARQGVHVTLIQNRPVLGGNSSSEVRVWVCGATAHGVQHFARETGIMGELFVENQFTNPEGNPYYWDLVVLEAVRAEPLISLYLNTEVHDVEITTSDDGPYDRNIQSVTGWQSGSERRLHFVADAFIDATGDGLVGYLAGAEYRTGRESRAELGESWAPEEADAETLGSTILFYTKDTGRPVKFVPPSFAKDITTTSIPDLRGIRTEANGCDYWWIEWGGDRDVVADNEAIRDELQAAVYGIWDHIKNSGKFDADTLALEWIGAVPGKREYRRFVGDHLLTQHDVLGQTDFTDKVAFGGWSIDLHPPGGMYAKERGSRHWHPDGNYHIPLRSLYSRNVANMWLSGRNISASHVAFGSARVMATCGVVGEASGTAAALALRHDLTPRRLATEELEVLHEHLVRADAAVLGLPHQSPADHALAARIHASSTRTSLSSQTSDETHPLIDDVGMIVPVDPALEGIELFLDASGATELVVRLHQTGRGQNYIPQDLVTSRSVTVDPGQGQWVRVDLPWQPEHPQNAFLVIEANEFLTLHTGPAPVPGVLSFTHRQMPEDERYTEQWRAWKQILLRSSPCFRLLGRTAAFDARRVVGGYARPFSGPQMWVSEPMSSDPAPSLELEWPEAVEVEEVAVIFDDDLEEDLINLHHHRTPFDVLPTLVRDYRIEARTPQGQGWQLLVSESGNRHRHRRHLLPEPLAVEALRLVVTATNGAEAARVVSLRAWAP